MLLIVAVSLLASLTSTAAQEQECNSATFVVSRGLDCAFNFQTANSTNDVAQRDAALDAICTAECAGSTADYLEGPPCNNPREAEGLRIWCLPAENAAISRCRSALPDLLDETLLTSAGACFVPPVRKRGAPSCPAGCDLALTALSAQIGCCFQAIYNLTAEMIQEEIALGTFTAEEAGLLTGLSSEDIWNLCSVPIPGGCTGDPFPMTPTVPSTEQVTTEGAIRSAATVITIATGAILSLFF